MSVVGGHEQRWGMINPQERRGLERRFLSMSLIPKSFSYFNVLSEPSDFPLSVEDPNH
jgi:hypothetical protein